MTSPHLAWNDDLTADQLAGVHALLRAAAATDGVDPVSEQAVLSLRQPATGGRSPHLLATTDGNLRGYAHLEPAVDGEPAYVELAVHPAHRRAGTGTALLARAMTGSARVWAHGDGAPARALAVSAGLVSVRELWQMRVELASSELPPLAERADVVLRTYAGPLDDEAVLAVNNEAFSWHPEQGGWTEQEIADRRAEPWFDAAGFFLAADAVTGELLGFHWTKVHAAQDGEPALGEVYVMGVAPSAQGRGLGRLLTLAGLHHLRDAGLNTVLLYVEADNTAALHTYERLGFTRFHVDRAYARG